MIYLTRTTIYFVQISVEDVASPTELAKAYMGSRPSKVSPSMLSWQSSTWEDSALVKGHHFAQKSPTMSIVPRSTNLARVYENSFVAPRSRGRSAIYNMARTPYARAYQASTLKVFYLLNSSFDHDSNAKINILFFLLYRVLGLVMKVGRHLQLNIHWIMVYFLELNKGYEYFLIIRSILL